MSLRQLQKQIHVACRNLGLDADMRHDIQIAACGKASMRDMTEADLKLVVNHLKARGFKTGFNAGSMGKAHKAAPRADLRYIHVLWTLLGKAGKLNVPTRKGLNTFVRSRFEATWGSVPADIDMLRDAGQINDITRALKDWCMRKGVELNK